MVSVIDEPVQIKKVNKVKRQKSTPLLNYLVKDVLSGVWRELSKVLQQRDFINNRDFSVGQITTIVETFGEHFGEDKMVWDVAVDCLLGNQL